MDAAEGMPDAEVSVAALVPVAATKKDRPCAWAPVKVVAGVVHLVGGFSSSPLAANSYQCTEGADTHTFVQMDKNAPWFLKGVGGPKVQKGDLKPVMVLHEIRDALHAATADAEGCDPAVAAGDAGDPTADDPMNALDDIPDEVPAAKAKPKSAPRTRLTMRSSVIPLQMPTRPRCCAAVAGCGETTTITVYRKSGVKPQNPRNNQNLYLRSDCLNWLLSYAADELYFQGVGHTPECEPQPRIANCPDVDGLHLEWDCSAKAWSAEFVAGAEPGAVDHPTIRFAVDHLTNYRWAKITSGTARTIAHVSHLNLGEKKDAAKRLIMLWCSAIANGPDAASAFASEYDLHVDDLETPQKRTRREARTRSGRSRGSASTVAAVAVL